MIRGTWRPDGKAGNRAWSTFIHQTVSLHLFVVPSLYHTAVKVSYNWNTYFPREAKRGEVTYPWHGNITELVLGLALGPKEIWVSCFNVLSSRHSIRLSSHPSGAQGKHSPFMKNKGEDKGIGKYGEWSRWQLHCLNPNSIHRYMAHLNENGVIAFFPSPYPQQSTHSTT